MDQINGCGHRAAEKYDDVIYWDYNWRKAGGSQRMIEISKRERCLLYTSSLHGLFENFHQAKIRIVIILGGNRKCRCIK